jgi:3-isopropylmalate/(R)-2-methylmalate dehydratase large subunit
MPKTLAIEVEGALPAGTTAKDLILHILNRLGVDGGTGHVIEYRGQAIRDLSMEGRMTVCNMSIEGGARAGPDRARRDHLRLPQGPPYAPQGADWDAALEAWRDLPTDEGATFDRTVLDRRRRRRAVGHLGHHPAQSVPVTGASRAPPTPRRGTARQYQRALDYMGLEGGEAITDIELDTVFIGSCTNGRIEDLREVAEVVRGQQGRRRDPGDGRARVGPGEGRRRGRGHRRGPDRGGLRLARAGLLDVPRA